MGRLVVGGFGLWVMAVGGLKCADQWWVGSVLISVFGGGANLCSDMFLSLFFYFGGGFGGGCGLILVVVFFFFLVIVAATIFLVVVDVVVAVVVDDEDEGEEFNILF